MNFGRCYPAVPGYVYDKYMTLVVFIALNACHNSLHTVITADSSDVTKQMMQRREVKRKAQSRRILGLIMIFMFFVILWLPIAVTFTIDYRQQLPAWVYVFLLTVAWINSSVNVFLYGYTNQLYRHAFKCILTCKFSQINTRG